MKKYYLIFLLFFIGCNNDVKSTSNPFGYKIDCIRGVVYYLGGDKMAPAFKQDGSLYLCNDDEK